MKASSCSHFIVFSSSAAILTQSIGGTVEDKLDEALLLMSPYLKLF